MTLDKETSLHDMIRHNDNKTSENVELNSHTYLQILNHNLFDLEVARSCTLVVGVKGQQQDTKTTKTMNKKKHYKKKQQNKTAKQWYKDVV